MGNLSASGICGTGAVCMAEKNTDGYVESTETHTGLRQSMRGTGENGLDLLSSLISTYFAQGGLQLHFVFADTAMLQDAIKHPDKYEDLLVRVTGFSEYFVRLSPDVQQEILRREQASR